MVTTMLLFPSYIKENLTGVGIQILKSSNQEVIALQPGQPLPTTVGVCVCVGGEGGGLQLTGALISCTILFL